MKVRPQPISEKEVPEKVSGGRKVRTPEDLKNIFNLNQQETRKHIEVDSEGDRPTKIKKYVDTHSYLEGRSPHISPKCQQWH